MKGIQFFVKHVFDIAFSLFAITILAPLWIIIAMLIKLDSPGSILFIQERPGLHGKLFRVYKFRSMKKDSELMIKGKEVIKNDERITRIGKFLRRTKLDETPQLVNILFLQMSLIGPRPERIASLIDYDDFIKRRLNVLPGITGLAQVNGNIYIPLSERYKYDVYYADNFSLWLDIKIFFKTFGVIFFGEEKYSPAFLADDAGATIVDLTVIETNVNDRELVK